MTDSSIQPSKNIIIRILGNDLSLLHGDDQTYSNLLFTISHEPSFKNTDKLYVLNRIINQEKRQQIIALLNLHSIPFVEIPFSSQEFSKLPKLEASSTLLCEKILEKKSSTMAENTILSNILAPYRLYIMNINAARNFCIEYGKKNGYKWIFVLDSNNFLTQDYYDSIINNIQNTTEYISIPQIRLMEGNFSNNIILSSPEMLDSLDDQEHQLAFKNTSTYLFNPDIPYGTMNKGEFLNALGVPGKWSGWINDLTRINITQRTFTNAPYQTLSKIIRLSPNNPKNNIRGNWINRMLSTYVIIKGAGLITKQK
jgi:hypothetical protein